MNYESPHQNAIDAALTQEKLVAYYCFLVKDKVNYINGFSYFILVAPLDK
jgi:hypothetical protein